MSEYSVSFTLTIPPEQVLSKARSTAEQQGLIVLEFQPNTRLVVKTPTSVAYWSIRMTIEATPSSTGSMVVIASRMVGIGPWNADHVKMKTTEIQMGIMQ